MQELPLLPTTVIGSWSFPGWYAKFCEDATLHPEWFGPEDREEAVRDAVRLAVDDQLRAGTDLITDGEMQRVDFNLGFYDRLTGIEPLPQGRLWGPPAHDQRSRYLCVAALGVIVKWAAVWNWLHEVFQMGWFLPAILVVCLALLMGLLMLWRIIEQAVFR